MPSTLVVAAAEQRHRDLLAEATADRLAHAARHARPAKGRTRLRRLQLAIRRALRPRGAADTLDALTASEAGSAR